MNNIEATTFVKMSGAGNSFVLSANKIFSGADINLGSKKEFAKKICSQSDGFGADGFLILNYIDLQSSIIWDFYNSDGSVAEMCGNAARCAAIYAKRYLGYNDEVHFQTLAGKISAQVLTPTKAKVKMPVAIIGETKSFNFNSEETTAFIVNTGVPHAVIELSGVDKVENKIELARYIRSNTVFGQNGSNVTFVWSQTPGKINAVTFERGVENYTLACGTGAVAAGVFNFVKNKETNSIIQMPGGELEIALTSLAESPFMVGEAKIIGEINLKD